MGIEAGIPSGHIEKGVLVKNWKRKNLLQQPELSFTLDKKIWDESRHFVKTLVMIVVKTDTYWLTAAEFDKLKIAYNYGNGDGYRVAVKDWHRGSHQEQML